MPQTKTQIRDLLASASARPKHRFGQNFMVDGNLVRAVADAGEVIAGEVVIEVGPGTGTLTDELLERGADVLAVEIDRDLAGVLRARLGGHGRFTLVEGDALANKHTLHPAVHDAAAGGAKLVANLPYNLASPLIVELLIAGSPLLAFTVQQEVAERIAAPPGGKTYGPLSVMCQALAEAEVLRALPPGAFWPPPKITSSLVRLRRRPIDFDPAALNRVVSTLFQRRRKTLRNAAEPLGDVDLAALGLDPQARPETLSVDDFLNLAAATA